MPNYRRAKVPGGTYFFTLVTNRREPLFDNARARTLLGDCFRECRERCFFDTTAIVLLPDHLHAIWLVPAGDAEYSRRWSWIKKEFTKRWLTTSNQEADISSARKKEGRRGVWQPRFWEPTIESDEDYERYFDTDPSLAGCDDVTLLDYSPSTPLFNSFSISSRFSVRMTEASVWTVLVPSQVS